MTPGLRTRLAGALFLAGAMAWLGHLLVAAVIVGVVIAEIHLVALRPDLAAALDAALHRGARRLGAAVSGVLLSITYVIIFVPGALVCRLPGLDPLRTRSRSAGQWGRRGVRPDRRHRTFGDDRPVRVLRRTSDGGQRRVVLGTRRVVLGAALVLALVATVVGGYTLLSDGGTTPFAPAAAPPAFDPFQSAALAGQPWAGEIATEFGEAFSRLSYSPVVGYYLPDHEGLHLNIADRERRSYGPAVLGGEPVDIWFFGGSALFGYGAQRDEYTIPSDVARLGEADGLELRVRNFGNIGHVNYQETQLLADLLGTLPPPDLVVFYDGYNDKGAQLAAGLGPFGAPGEVTQTFSGQFRSVIHEALREGGGQPVEPETRVQDLDEAVANFADVYDRGIDLARHLGEAYGFEVRHYWHPDIYTKDLVRGEEALLEPMGLDAFQYDTWVELSAAVRAGLPSGVVDLSDTLDDVDEPVLTSFVHTNELGARVMAQAIYDDLRSEALLPAGG